MVDRFLGSVCFAVLSLFVYGSIAFGVTPSVRVAKNESSAKSQDEQDLKLAQAETLVLPLVDEHLVELKPLLAKLKAKQPSQYRDAILELAKTAKRVEWAREKSPQTYALEVEMLQAKTQVNLSVARLRVRDTADEREKLRLAVERLVTAEKDRLELLAEQAAVRAEKAIALQQQTKNRADEKAARAENDIDQLVRMMLRRAGLDTKKAK